MVEISTSLLNVEENEILGAIYNLEVAKTDYFHIDVMDGKFVKKDTTEKMLHYTELVKQISNLPIDVHLMVSNIREHVDEYLVLKPNRITFHVEALENKEEILEMIKSIKEKDVKVGLSIKPNTKIEKILEYLPYIHMVLIMTVEPGEGGQGLIPLTLTKVEKLKEYIDNHGLELDIQVDGGINLQTAKQAKQAGANILVAGTYIVKANDYKVAIDSLK